MKAENEIQESAEEKNILINKELEKELGETFKDEEAEIERTFAENIGVDGVEEIKRLDGSGFEFNSKGLFYTRDVEFTSDDINSKVSNFLAIPKKQLNFVNADEETNTVIELKAITAPIGATLSLIYVPIFQIENGNCFLNEKWWSKIKFEQVEKKKQQIECINCLKKFMQEETVYQFVGFTKVDNKIVFLTNGGIVEDD